MTYIDTYLSPIGLLEIKVTEIAVKSISFNGTAKNRPGKNGFPPILETCTQQLDEYFTGARKIFDLPLDPDGTDFQKMVWNELLKIPNGQTTSYYQIASSLGDTGKTRAVGAANGKNPIGIIIPCHRVIGAVL